jgi:UDP-GlcNAc:undecaprenyl-phosphate GlcNAc-1-phosphate transferase
LERTSITVGIAVSVFLCGLIGFLDDFQNTHSSSRLHFVENPLVRLLVFLPIPIIVMMAFGVISGYINNPFDGYILLTNFSFNVAGKIITPLPYLFTLIWTLAIMNMISWTNGVDGQFGGVAGISILIIGILALRLVDTEPHQLDVAKVAFLGAGISFGFIPRTWYPSKIMWGFGAISVGLLLSSLSIVSRAKVATAIMVIMLPFLDGVITFFRRILQKKNPLKGDCGHLHHLLLERGWSPQKVAIFYWVATAFFGIVGLLTADKSSALITLILGGVVATVIVILNINKSRKKDVTGFIQRADTAPQQPLA